MLSGQQDKYLDKCLNFDKKHPNYSQPIPKKTRVITEVPDRQSFVCEVTVQTTTPPCHPSMKRVAEGRRNYKLYIRRKYISKYEGDFPLIVWKS